MTHRTAARSAFALVVTLHLSAAAHAQLFRTYLESTGSDANPCTLSAPCRLLPAALAAVANGGEVWMLDSANYNAQQVNITKSVTILAVPGALGSVVATGGHAININTAGVKVALRNLVIVPVAGAMTGDGINMAAGDELTVENCLIANLPQTGIFVSSAVIVRVTDTTIRDNGADGLLLRNGARGTVTRSTISGNVEEGIRVQGYVASTTTADIADSTLDGNASSGVRAFSMDVASAVLKVTIRGSRLVRNGNFGALAGSLSGALATLSVSDTLVSNNNGGIGSFASSKVWVSGNTVSGNHEGLYQFDGLFESAGNNSVRNNTMDTIGTITVISMN